MQSLLSLQFPFLFCVQTIIALVVFGNDVDELTGWIYLSLFIVLPGLYRFREKLCQLLQAPRIMQVLLILGAFISLLLYRQTANYGWDEHSLLQACLVLLLGCFSCLIALVADHNYVSSLVIKKQIGRSFLFMLMAWGMAKYYPMFPFLLLAIVWLISSVYWESKNKQIKVVSQHSSIEAYWVLFLMSMELSLVVWDYQVETDWSLHLLIGYLVIAVSTAALVQLRNGLGLTLRVLVLIILLLNVGATVLFDAYVISYGHSIGVGFGFAWGMFLLFKDEANEWIVSLALPISTGMIIGYAFYSNMLFVDYRLLFWLAIPLLLLLKHNKNNTYV